MPDARVGRGTRAEPFVKRPLCADFDGFSLHGSVRVEGRDRDRLEHLCRHAGRPAIGIDVFGLSDPNIPDLGFLGAPGCGTRASLDLLHVWIVAGATHSYSLPLSNTPALVSMHLYTQALVLQPGVNQLLGGAITSNGIDGLLGDL